ncbi:MAG: carbohydrate binding domain-containing protein [Opitutaceae bacterium]
MKIPLLLTALTLVAHPAWAVLKPFQIAWDDASPGVTSLAGWQDDPAGESGWVTVDGKGHFDVGGERIRFLGVNIGASDAFPAHAVAEKVAARLARFGINNVRFHHMDANWGSPTLIDYAQTTTRNLHPDRLDRLHYFISELKKNGVYSNINLLVSHDHRAADGLPAEIDQMEWKDKQVLSFFNDTMVDLQKEYATKLLGSTNPHTGLRLADDPAVAFVEILNENGAIQNWFGGLLDSMPEVFRTELNTRWNTWLQARFSSTADLLGSWGHRSEPLGANKLINGDFASGTSPWNLEVHDVAQRTATTTSDFNGQPSLKVVVTRPGGAGWHVQINQSNKSLEAGKIYTVSFWARSDQPVNLGVGIQRAHTDYAGLGFSLTAELNDQWQQFTSVFESTIDEGNARLNFNNFGNQLVTVWLADVRWTEGGEIGGLPEGVTLEAGNIASIPLASPEGGDTLAARRDWVRFLVDLENRYWEEMRHHIKETIGYQGLVFGTIISNSPPNVQARLDVVDSHAYWQHPEFPGIPWDADNWTINNVSMVNSPGGSTIGGLARQRVKGKPHTVTEYQHPSPNTYSSETPLLIAAYGALQDWDGIWLFDYGTGQDEYVAGFFDQAHHPTKMVNTLLAAALFRRFDVRPARKAYTMPLTPESEIEMVTTRGSAWRVGDGSSLGVPAELAAVSRLSLDVGGDATGLSAPPDAPSGNILESDTGELVWDTSRGNRGVVTVNTDRSKAVIGFIDGRSFALGNVTIVPGTTAQDWATVGLTLVEGERFDDPAGGRALLVTTGLIENTGMIWKDASRTSVGRNWGRAPTLVEMVPLTLTLPVTPDRVRLFSLDSSGNRIDERVVTGADEKATIEIDSASNTLWHEIVISPGQPVAPRITTQPQSLTVALGETIELSSEVSGYPEPAVTWFHNGAQIGTGPTLTLPGAGSADAGDYQATVTNQAGTLSTRVVQVDVRSLPSKLEVLSNIATRGRVAGGENVMIAGFVVEGTGSRDLLLRAVGPSMAQFNLADLLTDPRLDLFDQADPKVVMQSNDNWIPSEVAEPTQRTGAFTLTADADAAMTVILEQGVYTARISGVGGTSGVSLVEIYDATADTGVTDTRLANLSTRGRVETGASILIGGFVIKGEVPKKILIRGIGPGLGTFGVRGVLDDPVLDLFKQENGKALLIATNDNWASNPDPLRIQEATTTAGGFPLPADGLDAALLLWLEPGVFTAKVSGHPGETGVALVEVYGL